MKAVTLPSGEMVPALGQGTWMMGERQECRADEIAALRAGVEIGMTLIDTAEMYGDGAAETLIAVALGDVRDRPAGYRRPYLPRHRNSPLVPERFDQQGERGGGLPTIGIV